MINRLQKCFSLGGVNKVLSDDGVTFTFNVTIWYIDCSFGKVPSQIPVTEEFWLIVSLVNRY